MGKQTARTLVPRLLADKGTQITGEAVRLMQDQLDSLESRVGTTVSTVAGGSSSSSSALVNPILSAISFSTSDVTLLDISISGTMPYDARVKGLELVFESPTVAGGEGPSGNISPMVAEVWADGDGSAFSATARVPMGENGDWIVYGLPFSEDVRTALIPVTSLSPVTPTVHSAYIKGTLKATEMGNAALFDVNVQDSTFSISDNGDGTMTIRVQYLPPYLDFVTHNIGEFEGVEIWLEDPDGKPTGYGRQLYTKVPTGDPVADLGDVEFTVPTLAEGTYWLQLCATNPDRRIPFKPHAEATAARTVSFTVTSATLGTGLAPQVAYFTITQSSSTASSSGGVEGLKDNWLVVSFTPPSSGLWKGVRISRAPSSGGPSWPATGDYKHVADLIASGWESPHWGLKNATEHWIYKAESLNEAGDVNTVSAPRVLLTISADGSVTIANDAITEAKLASLAVTARALADAAVTSTKYAPTSIGSAAIGLAAINDAHIANLNVNKLTGNTMSITGSLSISASGALTIGGGANAVTVDASGLSAPSAGFSGVLSASAGIVVGYLAAVITSLGAASFSSLTLSSALGIAYGGTGATSAADARTALGLGSAATHDTSYFAPAAGVSHRHSITTTDVNVMLADGVSTAWVKVVNSSDPYTGYAGG